MSKFVCERLAKHHDRKVFTCGVTEVETWKVLGQFRGSNLVPI
jgi:hypothetical protein